MGDEKQRGINLKMDSLISNKAMLIKMSVSMWTARKYDKKASIETARNNNADEHKSGRFNKILIAEDAIKTIQKTVNEARTYHYNNTLPWGNDESRLLPANLYFQYTQKMRGYSGEFEKAVNVFIANYPALVEDARGRLGDMFNKFEYPAQDSLKALYSFSMTINPVPVSNDFRVEISEADLNAVRAEIEKNSQAAQAGAINELWDRLNKVLAPYARLSDPDAVFRDSLVYNVQDLCTLIPKLNITADPALNGISREINLTIGEYYPQTLRDDARARSQAIKEAGEFLERIKTMRP
jgi:hypothetical protein